MPQSIVHRDRGSDTRASAPQQLLWQRLGFPSRNIWSNIQGVLVDHGLPEATHLRHDFPMLDAVARARARALPFHEARDLDHLPAPGALSYPYGFINYCGAIDAGSGYARVTYAMPLPHKGGCTAVSVAPTRGHAHANEIVTRIAAAGHRERPGISVHVSLFP